MMNTEIASKLLALRKQNGFSQEELAEKLGVSRQAVSKWERGDASPDTENLISIAKIYGISLDRLFGLESEPVSERSVINLEKDNNTPSSVNSDGMRVMYPQNSSGEEIYISHEEEKIQDSALVRPYKEAEENYSTYFKYETVDDTVGQEQSYSSRNSKMDDIIDSCRNLEGKIRNDEKFYKRLMKFPYPVAVTALYMYMGAMLNLWHPFWMLFLTIPLYYTGIRAIRKRNANIFCYPVLVVLFYLASGFTFRIWHPGWLSFLTIPIYYWVINTNRSEKREQGAE